jgi:hypothetical protein
VFILVDTSPRAFRSLGCVEIKFGLDCCEIIVGQFLRPGHQFYVDFPELIGGGALRDFRGAPCQVVVREGAVPENVSHAVAESIA